MSTGTNGQEAATNPEAARVAGLLRDAIEAASLPATRVEARNVSEGFPDWEIRVEYGYVVIQPTTTRGEDGAEVPAYYAGYLDCIPGGRHEPDDYHDVEIAVCATAEEIVSSVVGYIRDEQDRRKAEEEAERHMTDGDASLDVELRATAFGDPPPSVEGGDDMTAEEYAESDFAYDAARERRAFGGGRVRW